MVKRIYGIFIVAALLACCAAPAAQAKMDPFDVHVASLKVLEDRAVQKELGITPTQRAQMDMYADQYNTQMKMYLDQMKKQGKSPGNGPDEKMLGMLITLKGKVLTVLTSSQLRRLREISLQVFGLNGLMDDVVAQKVGLSKDQLTRMRRTYEQGSKKASDMMTGALEPVNAKFKNAKPKNKQEEKTTSEAYTSESKKAIDKVMPQVQKVREDTQKTILAMITPKQKNAYLALQGKKFSFK